MELSERMDAPVGVVVSFTIEPNSEIEKIEFPREWYDARVAEVAQLEAELKMALGDAKNMHANWDAACNNLAQLEAELDDERDLRYKIQNETSKRIYELEVEHKRLMERLDVQHAYIQQLVKNLDTLEEGG